MNKQTLKPSLITAFQRSYRLKWSVSRIYWALAEHESGESQRKIFQMLALKSDRSAVCYAIRLHRLGGTLPSNADSRRDRLWRWLLVNWSSYRAIAWIEWLEKRDTTLYLRLLAHHFKSDQRCAKMQADFFCPRARYRGQFTPEKKPSRTRYANRRSN